ncbi:SLAIN motif-containing protein 1-like isoform X1 [Ctenopharyngodon idella]|uniref:SLAIN motif-containing protein 1-like isoform X1 n=1 Tax=Ctenopharyngodon idella TaxID=7959 RepID=UPI002232879B|nr:SLAIN motif-containing protein 1-like isoform X1 [Ctenopharyngodon idella]
MEAAVLKPQMMADVRAELEVQKLQELVRKLERQNEQLRTRANIVPPSPACLRAGSCCIPSPAPSLACQYFPPDDPFPYFQPHSAADEDDEDDEEDDEPRALLDELMLLDLETVSPSGESEETWLYVSPSSHLWSGAGLNALQWCRHVLDQMETSRNSLCPRLEPVSRWRSGFSSPAVPRARVVGVSPLCTSSPSCKPCAPLPSSTCERAGRSVRRSVFAQASVDSDVSVSELDDDSVTLGYKLQDLTDVQVMARLQEESLRQDFATTSSSSSNNRRSASFSFQFGPRSDSHLDEEEEDEDEDYGQLPPPQPRLSRAGALQRGLPHSHTFSSIRDWRSSSTSPCSAAQTQTPAQTPASETHGLRSSSVEYENKLRRSMPNLLSAPMPSVPAPVSPSMRSSQSFDSPGALTRLQTCIPAPGQLQTRVQSVGNFSSRQTLKATAYVSPTIKGPAASVQCVSGSGIPQPGKASVSQIPARSGLPRPASFIASGSGPRSKLTAPVRSLLTPPKSLATLSALRDGSWRDGCY